MKLSQLGQPSSICYLFGAAAPGRSTECKHNGVSGEGELLFIRQCSPIVYRRVPLITAAATVQHYGNGVSRY